MPGAAITDWTELIRSLAHNEAHSLRFEERRFLFYLDAPLVTRGELRFEPPDTLIRRIESPRPMQLRFQDDQFLREEADGRQEHIPLAAHPLLIGTRDLLLALVSGDPERLQARFQVTLERPAPVWQLRLVPREKSLRDWIREIHIRGQDRRLRGIVITEVNGDRTETRFLDEPDDAP